MLQNNKKFKIESFISTAYFNRGLMAIGYFTIEINGKHYGVKKKDATALACSYDSVMSRIKMRGNHTAPEDFTSLTSLNLAHLTQEILFANNKSKKEWNLNISKEDLIKKIYANNLLWAPDGDEAFDDGSNIFQFDLKDNQVRLIGYKALDDEHIDIDQLSDTIISADEYYLTLIKWAEKFYNEWKNFDKI